MLPNCIVLNGILNNCVSYLYHILNRNFVFQYPYPVMPANCTLHIFYHFARKTEPNLCQYLWKYITRCPSYVAQVGKHHLKMYNKMVDKYKKHIVMPDTPLDMLRIFLLARLYRVHVGLILKGGS